MSVYLAPGFGVGWQAERNSLPLVSGKLYTYIAGGTTPQATYTTYLGNVQNSNPITLGTDGRPPSEIWLTHGVSYRFDLKDSLGNLLETFDNVSMSSFVATTDLADTSGSSLVGFIQGGTSPTAETVQTALRRIVYPEQFGAVGNGSTDDKTALTNFINYLLANSQVEGRMLSKTYAISGALPQVTVSGFTLRGFGPSSNHDVGVMNGTVLKAITNSGFTMLTVAPTEGASAQRLDGVCIEGISFNCNALAAIGLLVKSVHNGTFNNYYEEATSAGLELGVVTTLGEACDLQDCVFRVYGRNINTTGRVLKLSGTSSANVSLNYFPSVDVEHKDATAIVNQNPDNNCWGVVRVYRHAGGTATNSIEWQGGATATQCSRFEVYEKLTTTVAAIAKGTGTYTVGAHDILIKTLDSENNTPTPTVETGASVAGVWISFTSTISASVGTITTKSAAAFYKIDPNDPKVVYIRIAITVTTNGTGSGILQATMPFTAANDSVSGSMAGYEAVTGNSVIGKILANTSTLQSVFYNATYPGADSYIITLNGWYKRA